MPDQERPHRYTPVPVSNQLLVLVAYVRHGVLPSVLPYVADSLLPAGTSTRNISFVASLETLSSCVWAVFSTGTTEVSVSWGAECVWS